MATSSFGSYSFSGLQSGETYVITVISERFAFSAPSRVIMLGDNVVNATLSLVYCRAVDRKAIIFEFMDAPEHSVAQISSIREAG
jgi:hypothetical protein